MSTSSKPAGWFWIVSIIALLWNLGGIMSFVMRITITPEMLSKMTEQERTLYTGIPLWITVTYAIAVFGSTLGSVLLLLRKNLATTVLIISFIAILIQMTYTLVFTNAIESQGPAVIILPAAIIIIGGFLVWFSRKAAANGWIR